MSGKTEFLSQLGNKKSDFAGKLLVAMPFMQDTRFEQSVIYICGHDAYGCIGFIVNKPMQHVTSEGLLTQMGLPEAHFSVFYGGPIEPTRGFVLHTNDYQSNGTVPVSGGSLCVTSTADVLRNIAQGNGPSNFITCLGYTGWSANQLEKEIQDDSWLLIDVDDDIIFNSLPNTLWNQCMERMRINPWSISPYPGRA